MAIDVSVLKKLIGFTIVVVYNEGGRELAITGYVEDVINDTLVISTKANTYFIDANNINKIKIKRV